MKPVTARGAPMTVQILPIDIPDYGFFEALGSAVEAELPLRCKTARPIPISADAYDSKRGQYHAEALLRRSVDAWRDLSAHPTHDDPSELMIAVVDEDLYADDLNFVFGLAAPRLQACIVALARLHAQSSLRAPNPERFFDRVVKEAVHELGHLLGLPHCPSSNCVMRFSNTLTHTDRKSRSLCTRCRRRLEKL